MYLTVYIDFFDMAAVCGLGVWAILIVLLSVRVWREMRGLKAMSMDPAIPVVATLGFFMLLFLMFGGMGHNRVLWLGLKLNMWIMILAAAGGIIAAVVQLLSSRLPSKEST